MTDDEIISIAVETSLLNYIDNETPRRFFVSGHAELDDVVSFGRVIAATAFEKASNVMGAEVERLRAALEPFACNCRVLDCEQRIIPSEQCPRRVARAALGEEK